ncbi:hypothetical protein [uncultured Sphingomonas sp.]|uniref:hypothetical protein n=1 Tax=uncultured Sphingomonas sp. TaxID=158754 RepID=UPI0025E924DF|nr:hypothetical protein [uncultured Sphingomonas sp.]
MIRHLALGGLLLLAACGDRQSLRPPNGAALPPKPATAPAVPTADQLLALPPAVRPGRSDELITRSQPRADDPFDLPPR